MDSSCTVYSYLDKGYLTARNLDLIRKVGYRPRSKKAVSGGDKVDKRCRIGRSDDDFKRYMLEHTDTPLVEMDTVKGSKSKVLLTIHFVEKSLMLAFLREANTACSVTEKLTGLKNRLGQELLAMPSPVILTDNGTEFSAPVSIEALLGGLRSGYTNQ